MQSRFAFDRYVPVPCFQPIVKVANKHCGNSGLDEGDKPDCHVSVNWT